MQGPHAVASVDQYNSGQMVTIFDLDNLFVGDGGDDAQRLVDGTYRILIFVVV